MSTKKILITGLGIGKEIGVCDSANMNYSELLINPEIILWADKICLPKSNYFDGGVIGKEEELVFSILDDADLIERFDDSIVDNFVLPDFFLDQSIKDFKSFLESNPSIVPVTNNADQVIEAYDEEHTYCIPRIASINASMLIANELNAQCLYSKADAEYLRFKYDQYAIVNKVTQYNSIYREILSVVVPNDSILHEYGTHGGCIQCRKQEQCNDSYLKEVQDNLLHFLEMRNYDEMYQLRSLIDDIYDHKDALLDVECEDIIEEIRMKQVKLKKIIHLRFPKIKRAANIIACVAIPLTIVASTTGHNTLAAAAGILSGVSVIADKSMDSFKSKTNWINFIDKNDSSYC